MINEDETLFEMELFFRYAPIKFIYFSIVLNSRLLQCRILKNEFANKIATKWSNENQSNDK